MRRELYPTRMLTQQPRKMWESLRLAQFSLMVWTDCSDIYFDWLEKAFIYIFHLFTDWYQQQTKKGRRAEY